MEFIYCAFCKHGRKAYTNKHLAFKDVLYCLLLSALLMMVFWQSFHPAVFVIFILFLFIGESIINFRRRVSIQCKYCGFDPVLYVKSPSLAEAKVKKVLEEQADSADFLFKAKNPFEHLVRKENEPIMPKDPPELR